MKKAVNVLWVALLLLVPCVHALVNENMTRDLVLSLSFDQENVTASSILDQSTYQDNATIVDTAKIINSTGVNGQVFNCTNSATAGGVSIKALNLSGDSNRTISTWVKPRSITANDVWFWHGTFSSTQLDSLGFIGTTGLWKFWGYNRDVSVSAPNLLPLNTWTHTLATISTNFTNSSYKLYNNGTLSVMQTNNNLSTTVTNYVLCKDVANTYTYDGEIDNVRVWNRTLTQEEITFEYNNGSRRDFDTYIHNFTIKMISPLNDSIDQNNTFIVKFMVDTVFPNVTCAIYTDFYGGEVYDGVHGFQNRYSSTASLNTLVTYELNYDHSSSVKAIDPFNYSIYCFFRENTTTIDGIITTKYQIIRDYSKPTATFNTNNFFNSSGGSIISNATSLNKLINFTLEDNFKLAKFFFTINRSNGILIFEKNITGYGTNFTNVVNFYANLSSVNGLHLVTLTVFDNFSNNITYSMNYTYTNATFVFVNPPYTNYNTFLFNVSFNINITVNGTFMNYTKLNYYFFNGSLIQSVNISTIGSGTYNFNYLTPKKEINNMSINVTMYDLYGGIFNSETYLVKNIYFDNCSVSSLVIINFSVYDENNPTKTLVTQTEININYTNNKEFLTISYSNTMDNKSYYEYCMDINGNNYITANVYIKYSTTNGFTNRYYVYQLNLTNSSIYNIIAYDSNTTTSFSNLRITTRKSTDYDYFPNIVTTLQRFYVGENVWRNVQMDQTGDYGLSLFHVIEGTTDYRLLFRSRTNQLYKTSEMLRFSCTSSMCDVTYLLDPDQISIGYGRPVIYTVTYNNNTNIINISWVDITQSTTSVYVSVTKPTGLTYIMICNTTQTGGAGSIACDVTNYNGELFVSAWSSQSPLYPDLGLWVYAEGNNATISDYYNNHLPSNDKLIYSAFILITCVGAGAYTAMGAMLGLLIGIVAIITLGYINIHMTALFIAFIVISIIIIMVRYNKKPQNG